MQTSKSTWKDGENLYINLCSTKSSQILVEEFESFKLVLISEFFMQFDDYTLFFFCVVSTFYTWPEVVHPSQSAALPTPR